MEPNGIGRGIFDEKCEEGKDLSDEDRKQGYAEEQEDDEAAAHRVTDRHTLGTREGIGFVSDVVGCHELTGSLCRACAATSARACKGANHEVVVA